MLGGIRGTICRYVIELGFAKLSRLPPVPHHFRCAERTRRTRSASALRLSIIHAGKCDGFGRRDGVAARPPHAERECDGWRAVEGVAASNGIQREFHIRAADAIGRGQNGTR